MTYRVLFVDDEGAVLRALTRQLNFSLDLTTAYSAQEALRLMSGQGRFDALVTDINMPGISGLELAEQAAEINPYLPVIILSGCQDPETLARMEAIPNIVEVLAKPATADVVMKAIETAKSKAASSVG